MISNAEMDRRWAATRLVMARDGIDWLIASTGHPWGYYRWLTNRIGLAGPLAAIGMEGDVILASHGDEVHHQPHDSYGVRHVASCSQLNMMVNSHAPLLVKEMRAKPVRRIGLLGTGFIPVATYKILRDAFPDAEIIDATDAIARLKAIKSPEEMALILEAAAMHDEGVEIARRTLRPGITARDVVEEVRSFFTRNRSGTQTMMGGSSPRNEICRYSGPIDRKIESGDLFSMLIECSTESGYFSEAMPTMCLGDPPGHLTRAFAHACESQELLARSVRPGMLPSELLAINDAFMTKHGYPTEHRLLGHSQGLDLVERPAFSPLGENLSIEHDMVISIHPTVHTPNAWGLPNNLSFHFTANGIERLLRTPQQVFVVA
jgi:Xaa-Pro aminopeptidase